MIKELLSDFYKIIQPSYEPESPQPYVSMILTVVSFTILTYGLQIFTTNTHTYAQDPIATQNKISQDDNCNIFFATSLQYLCWELTNGDDTITYKSEALLSFEQDLQSDTK